MEKLKRKRRVLGVDVGGVIIDRSKMVPGVVEALSELVSLVDEVVIVSRASEKIERRTREYLAHHQFYELTRIKPENTYFCQERADKAPICKKLGVTHFVDDRLEVLGYLETVEHKYLFRPSEDEIVKFARDLASVCRVESWQEILQSIRGK